MLLAKGFAPPKRGTGGQSPPVQIIFECNFVISLGLRSARAGPEWGQIIIITLLILIFQKILSRLLFISKKNEGQIRSNRIKIHQKNLFLIKKREGRGGGDKTNLYRKHCRAHVQF